tara:strand:+ start:43 stop:567 length:525 start_codon:yes stop_codon:yes gene_type:complete
MPCPNVADDEISMFKTGRERTGAGYDSNYNLATPVYMSDIQRLSGGNTSGSGHSYPPVALANPINNRPDGENPLGMSEFSLYDQNPPRTAFMYNYNSSSYQSACPIAIVFDTYYHTDPNNLVPSSLNIYTAYTTQTGTTVAASGYYAIYTTSGQQSGSWMQVGNNGLIIATGSC